MSENNRHMVAWTPTKILATLGPASNDADTIRRMIEAGASGFRVNFSHGTLEEHDRAVANVRKAAEETGRAIAILGDLPGPKIRVAEVSDEGRVLRDGDRVAVVEKMSPGDLPGDAKVAFSINHPELVREIETGHAVLVEDGRIGLIVEEETGDGDRVLICRVNRGGRIQVRKGVNLPDTPLSLPGLTEKDREFARFAVEHDFDYLALSFVRSAKDVRELKDLLGQLGVTDPGRIAQEGGVFPRSWRLLPVITKIEKPQALRDLDAIIRESDAVMVARGDLGVEMDLSEVPVLQKKIIAQCRNLGRPVIVATQMLESMIRSESPTRAEVSDVANAIFDGTDTVMLSGETAIGEWPVETVRMMNEIARRSDAYRPTSAPADPPARLERSSSSVAAIAHGVIALARHLEARLVALSSRADGMAVYLSRYRFACPIVAFTPDAAPRRRMALLYGVRPVHLEMPGNSEEFVARADEVFRREGWASPGDPVVTVFPDPFTDEVPVNRIGVHRVGG